MKMKDKLEKFGHKRGYYAARKTFACFIATLCLFSVVAIPTYIATRSEAANGITEQHEIEDNDTDIDSVNDNK